MKNCLITVTFPLIAWAEPGLASADDPKLRYMVVPNAFEALIAIMDEVLAESWRNK